MEFRDFINLAKALASIDRDRLVAAGFIHAADEKTWRRFDGAPFQTFMEASDERKAKIWPLICPAKAIPVSFQNEDVA